MTCHGFLVPEWDGVDVTIRTHPAPVASAGDEGKHDRDYRPPDWKPRTGTVEGTISAGDRIGKPFKESGIVRREKAGDHHVGEAVGSVLDGWKVRELSPGRWVEDKGGDGG